MSDVFVIIFLELCGLFMASLPATTKTFLYRTTSGRLATRAPAHQISFYDFLFLNIVDLILPKNQVEIKNM